MNKTVETYFVDIIRNRLSMTNAEIWVASQDKQIPKDDGLYIIVSNISTIPVAVNSYFDNVNNTNIVESNSREDIQIDLFSKGNRARDERYRVILALRSFYSQSIQEKEFFKIFRISSSFINTTELEGGSMLNRFSIRIPCYTWHRETFDTEYYDKFTRSVIYD